MASIAVVGSGISGLTAAWVLSRKHQVTIFEAGNYLGGHTNTHELEIEGRTVHVDTGFIVYNDRTYPNFIRLLNQTGCRGIATEMSFSVHRPGLEYNGHDLNTLFAQRRNIVRPSFWRMLRDILRFNRDVVGLDSRDRRTIGEFLGEEGYSQEFQRDYLLPMAAAIWSTGRTRIREFPLYPLATFFRNHGLVSLKDRPQWRVVEGGSNTYVRAMADRFRDVHLNTPVVGISRKPDHVDVHLGGQSLSFDEVVIATHSDQALAMLEDPSDGETDILGAMGYERNQAVLHTDASVLPRRRLAWASWNYHLDAAGTDRATLTYNMNILQHLPVERDILVTLNDEGRIDPEKILKKISYEHPRYDLKMMDAQKRWNEISGRNRTHYCGAYWRFGFHEDGVVSALDVCRQFGMEL